MRILNIDLNITNIPFMNIWQDMEATEEVQ